MKTYTVSSFEDLHKFLICFRGDGGVGWCYRGQANIEWPLLPAAGRPEYYTGRDLGRLNYWRQQAIAFHPDLAVNDWESLAIAQHHGLATRLLDWTANPLVAAYFASGPPMDVDGAVYCYLPQQYVRPEVLKFEEADTVLAYVPRALNPRLVRQAGLFTYHPEPNSPLTPKQLPTGLGGNDDLMAVCIPAETKIAVREVLDFYGINEVTLFPDLDGLSRHINWETRAQVQRRNFKGKAKTGMEDM